MLLLALWPSYSSCDPYSYGTTGNAASTALSWGMSSVLPDIPGLDVNGLLYKYTTVKNPEDDMKVHVRNLNAKVKGTRLAQRTIGQVCLAIQSSSLFQYLA